MIANTQTNVGRTPINLQVRMKVRGRWLLILRCKAVGALIMVAAWIAGGTSDAQVSPE